MRTPKHAGFLVDSLSSGVKRFADAPAVKLVGGLANMTEAGRALAGHAGSLVDRATDAAKKIEASPAYGVARDVHGLARDVHGLAQDIRHDPDFRQLVVDPIKAHPLTQVATAVASPLVEGAKGVVHGAVDPVLSRARGAVDQVNQFADSVNRAAEPVIPLVDTAQRVQQKAEAAGQRLDAIKAKADEARARVTEALFPSQTPAALPATSSAPAPAEPAPTAPQASPTAPEAAPQAAPQAAPTAPASAAPWYKRLYSYLYGITNRYGINDPNTRKSFIDSVISRVMGLFRRQKTSSARVTPRSIHHMRDDHPVFKRFAKNVDPDLHVLVMRSEGRGDKDSHLQVVMPSSLYEDPSMTEADRRQVARDAAARTRPADITQVMPYLMGKHGADSGAWQRSGGKNPEGGARKEAMAKTALSRRAAERIFAMAPEDRQKATEALYLSAGRIPHGLPPSVLAPSAQGLRNSIRKINRSMSRAEPQFAFRSPEWKQVMRDIRDGNLVSLESGLAASHVPGILQHGPASLMSDPLPSAARGIWAAPAGHWRTPAYATRAAQKEESTPSVLSFKVPASLLSSAIDPSPGANNEQQFTRGVFQRFARDVKVTPLGSPLSKLSSDSGAWQRSEGKNPSGGLNAKGRASLKAQGHDIKPGVRGAADTPEKLRRKGSFLSRMFGPGAPGSMKKDNGDPSRRALSAAAWGEAVPKNDAGRARLYAKGQRLLARYKATKQAEAAGHAAHGPIPPLSPETLQRLRSAYLREGATAGAIRGALGGGLAGYMLSDDDDKLKGVLTGAGLGLGAGAGLGGAHGLHIVSGDSPALFVREILNEPSYNRESLSLKRPGRFTNELLSTTFHPGDWVHNAQNPNNPKAPPFRLYEDPSPFSKDVISTGLLGSPPPRK